MAGGQHPTGRWRPMTPRANCLTCCRISFAAPPSGESFSLEGYIHMKYSIIHLVFCFSGVRRARGAAQVASRCHLWRPASVHRVSHPSQCMIVLIILVRFIKSMCHKQGGVLPHPAPAPLSALEQEHPPHRTTINHASRIHGSNTTSCHRIHKSCKRPLRPAVARLRPTYQTRQAWQPQTETYI